MVNKNKTPWPTAKAMQQVYQLNLWGSNGEVYYSGEGSHNSILTEPYIKVLSKFLKSFKHPISVCDFGCGDFNMGQYFVDLTSYYTAIDIVPELIEYNRKKFTAKNLNFECLDIATDNLPKADCVIIRQVLQHLSNQEIKQILNKLYQYQYVILTEHLPKGDFIPNIDIISGQGIRIKKKSGLDILSTPFNFKIKLKEEWLSLNLPNQKGVIKTTLYHL